MEKIGGAEKGKEMTEGKEIVGPQAEGNFSKITKRKEKHFSIYYQTVTEFSEITSSLSPIISLDAGACMLTMPCSDPCSDKSSHNRFLATAFEKI